MGEDSLIRDPKALEDRGQYWQHRMRLDHWKIRFRWTDAEEFEETQGGEAKLSEDYDRATISVAYNLEDRMKTWNVSHDPVDYILVHELMHVMLRGTDGVMRALLSTLGYVAGDGHRSRWHFEEENLADRVTEIILNLEKGDSIPCQCNASESTSTSGAQLTLVI